MTTNIARFANYIPPPARGLFIYSQPFDELGEAVLALHNERFKGVRDIEDTTEYKPNQPPSFSNTPRILSYNQFLRQETNGRIRVLSPVELVEHYDAIPDKPTTYADTDAIAVFPNPGPNEDLRQRVLAIIGRTTTNVPLLVSGLGVEKADNTNGFTFSGTEYMKVTEAPYAIADGKVTYAKQGLIRSKQGVSIWTPQEQSGLRRAYRYRDGDMYLRNGRLLSSDSDGRVQVISDPLGSEKNLEELAKNLEELAGTLKREHEKEAEALRARYEQAVRLLRTR